MNKSTFDYAIVGAGAAGLNLALAMAEDSFFDSKQIIILDKLSKNINDKTWCYWEIGDGKFDVIASKIFDNGLFITNNHSINLSLNPYRYKMIRSVDFYNYCRKILSAKSNFTWIEDEISSINSTSTNELIGKGGVYIAKHVFDSRIDSGFNSTNDSYSRVIQHFKGWIIKTPHDTFDSTQFTMMDYRLKWKTDASFTYVIPLDAKTALIEFTLFNTTMIDDKDYDIILEKYIDEILKIKDYKIEEVEKGIIPMSDYPFHQHSTNTITKIGTAGGWVKPSSGYSFKNAQENSAKIVALLKKGVAIPANFRSARFEFYDSIFLSVLSKENNLGESVFTSMYTKNKVQNIFKFLDEKTTLLEEINIIRKFDWLPFLKGLFRIINRK